MPKKNYIEYLLYRQKLISTVSRKKEHFLISQCLEGLPRISIGALTQIRPRWTTILNKYGQSLKFKEGNKILPSRHDNTIHEATVRSNNLMINMPEISEPSLYQNEVITFHNPTTFWVPKAYIIKKELSIWIGFFKPKPAEDHMFSWLTFEL